MHSKRMITVQIKAVRIISLKSLKLVCIYTNVSESTVCVLAWKSSP